tara:strand:- start:100 stop:423 length:324 start_codon:yes stop_codon:yes gene_type:complete
MSLLFKPTIADTFEHIRPVATINVKPQVAESEINKPLINSNGYLCGIWSSREINLLINMRALQLTYRECGKHLNRSTNSCGSAVQTHNLYKSIEDKKEILINGVLNG